MLVNSKIKVQIEDNAVVNIDQITLQQPGVFEGSYVDVREVVIDANDIEIQNGRVTEAIILTHNVTEKSRINHMLAEQLIVLPATTASAGEEPRLMLDFYESNIKTVDVLKENVDVYLESFTAIHTINFKATGASINAPYINNGPFVYVNGDIETFQANAPLESLHFSSTKDAVISGDGKVRHVYIKTEPVVTIDLSNPMKSINTITRNLILSEQVRAEWVSPSPEQAIINIDEVIQNIGEYVQ